MPLLYSNPIEFPGLGIGPFDPNPIIELFGLKLHWYGVLIALGFLLAVIYAVKNAPRFGLNPDHLADGILWVTPFAIISARIYYVIFNWVEYSSDPLSVFKIWEGGIAVYGSFIGAIAAALVYCRVRKMNMLATLDLTAISFLIGQAVGRWGNFMNREAYGGLTNFPWRMEIYAAEFGERSAVHPAFLYESLWNILGFVLLHIASKKLRKYDGQMLLMYLCWYGLGRGFIEGLRTDSLMLLNLRVSQFLGFASFLVAGILLIYNALFRKYDAPAEPENTPDNPPEAGSGSGPDSGDDAQ